MDLYENTLIGTFLYGLGIEVGAHAGTKPFASGVDLLQQTPLDASLADLLIQSPSFVRLFEFKRAVSRDPKESRKRRFLERVIGAEDDADRLRDIANAIHWHIESTPRVDTSPVLQAKPYFGDDADSCDVTALCQRTAAAMRNPSLGPSPDDCARYLSVIRKSGGTLSKASGGGSTLLVAVKKGILMHAHVNDLTDITLRHQQLREIQETLSRALQKERDRLREVALEQLRAGRERESLGKGYEMDFN